MVKRTVVFYIKHAPERHIEALRETISLFTKAFNKCVVVAWKMKRPTGPAVHKKTYYPLKNELGLRAQYLCSARNKAIEVVTSAKTLIAKGKKVSMPISHHIPLRLDQRTFTLNRDNHSVSVTTQQRRISKL